MPPLNLLLTDAIAPLARLGLLPHTLKISRGSTFDRRTASVTGRSVVSVAGLCILAACGTAISQVNQLEERPAISDSNQPAAHAAPPLEQSTAPAANVPDPIGLSSVARTPAAARRANRAGLRLHEQGIFRDAEAKFSEAVSAAPEYTTARFNRACALSRLGRHREALDDMIVVMRQNLPGFYARIESDEDLASLHSSPLGAAFAEARQGILSEYLDAFRSEVAVTASRDITEAVPPEERDWVQPQTSIRSWPGVYKHATRRFIPMIPPIRSPFSGGFSQPAVAVQFHPDQEIVFTMTGIEHDGGIHCCQGWGPVTRLGLFHAGSGTSILERRVRSSPGTDEPLWSARADGRNGLYWNVTETEEQIQRWYHQASRDTSPRVVWEDRSWSDPDTTPPALPDDLRQAMERGDRSSSTRGFSFRGNRLITPEGNIVELGPGHAVFPDKTVRRHATLPLALVFGEKEECDEDGCMTTDHFVDLVFLDTGEVTELSRGDYGKSAVFGRDSSVYLGPLLRRFDADRRQWETTLEGLTLL